MSIERKKWTADFFQNAKDVFFLSPLKKFSWVIQKFKSDAISYFVVDNDIDVAEVVVLAAAAVATDVNAVHDVNVGGFVVGVAIVVGIVNVDFLVPQKFPQCSTKELKTLCIKLCYYCARSQI